MFKKKVVKKIIIVVGLMVLCTGCSKKSMDQKLVGTWELEGGSENRYNVFEFYEDGSYKHASIDYGTESVNVSGDYKVVSEEDIELTSTASGLGQDMAHIAGIHKFVLDGDTFKLEGGGAKGTYHKQ